MKKATLLIIIFHLSFFVGKAQTLRAVQVIKSLSLTDTMQLNALMKGARLKLHGYEGDEMGKILAYRYEAIKGHSISVNFYIGFKKIDCIVYNRIRFVNLLKQFAELEFNVEPAIKKPRRNKQAFTSTKYPGLVITTEYEKGRIGPSLRHLFLGNYYVIKLSKE